MRKRIQQFALGTIFIFEMGHGPVLAEPQTDAALTLLEPSGARIVALGGAGTALANDITSFSLNPSNLSTLSSGQASFLFQRGMAKDSFGQFLLGLPGQNLGWGMSVGYFNSGTIDVYDGTSQQNIIGQRDLTMGLGFAQKFGPASWGLTGKYFYSQLGERASAHSVMADFGGQLQIHSRLSIGASVQNLGGKIQYVTVQDRLPQSARFGLSWLLRPGPNATTLLADEIYQTTTHKSVPAVGMETLWGPLAFRAGYKSGRDLEEFSFGTGFAWGTTSLDYSFGLVQDLSNSHCVSLTTRFGGLPATNLIVKIPGPPQPQISAGTSAKAVYEIKDADGNNPPAQIYRVKQGDTLQSIALHIYGNADLWDEIFRANQHILSDPSEVKPGQKILLPAKTP